MIGFLIFAILLILFLVISIIYLSPGSKGKATTVPGPDPSNKELGNLVDLGKAGSLHQYLVLLHKEYGPIAGFYWGQQFVVSIACPDLFKQHVHLFNRPPELFALFEPLIGKQCIQYANNEDGRARRAAYDIAFKRGACLKSSDIIINTGQQLIKLWSSKTSEDHIPLQAHIMALALKSVIRFCYGNYMNDDHKVLAFRKAYDSVWSEMEHRLTHGPAPEDDSRTKKFEEDRQFLKQTIKDIVDDRMKTRSHREKMGDVPDEAPEFMDILIDHCGSNSEKLISDALAYAVGGFHTTGNAVVWAIYYLCLYPETQKTLQLELDAAGGADELVSSSSAIEALLNLPYLRQVIDETLRCAVVAPWAARYSDSESLLGGHKIPAKTPVIHALGVVQQDPEFFPEPEIFRPERMDKAKLPPKAFQPFGFAGKRKCPGHRFFYIEMSVWLAQIFSKFDVRLAGEEKEVAQVFGLVTHPEEEIWVRLETRENK